MSMVTPLSKVYNWGKRGSERLNNMSKVSHPVKIRATFKGWANFKIPLLSRLNSQMTQNKHRET